jgi:hypothetical protein
MKHLLRKIPSSAERIQQKREDNIYWIPLEIRNERRDSLVAPRGSWILQFLLLKEIVPWKTASCSRRQKSYFQLREESNCMEKYICYMSLYNSHSYQILHFLVSFIISLSFWGIDSKLTYNVIVQVVQEYERAVIFRLGRLLSGGSRGPGETTLFKIQRTSWNLWLDDQEVRVS